MVFVIRRVLSLAVVVAAALTVTGPAAPAKVRFVRFMSPSGNISCIGNPAGGVFPASAVDCLVKQSTWPRKPPKPASCDLAWNPTWIDLSVRQVSVGHCGDRPAGGTLCANRPAIPCTTLAYGRSVDIGSIRCTSATNGVMCRYRAAPRVGFRIARKGYVVFRS